MGNFYTQVLVSNDSSEACEGVMKAIGRRALIGPKFRNIVPIFDSESEKQEIGELDSVALTLSHELQSWAVGIMNHDDDYLLFRLFYRGEELQHISASRMGSFNTSGLNSLRKAVCPKAPWVSLYWALSRPALFQVGRHQSVARALGLASWTVGAGYRYLQAEDVEEHPGLDQFVSL